MGGKVKFDFNYAPRGRAFDKSPTYPACEVVGTDIYRDYVFVSGYDHIAIIMENVKYYSYVIESLHVLYTIQRCGSQTLSLGNTATRLRNVNIWYMYVLS